MKESIMGYYSRPMLSRTTIKNINSSFSFGIVASPYVLKTNDTRALVKLESKKIHSSFVRLWADRLCNTFFSLHDCNDFYVKICLSFVHHSKNSCLNVGRLLNSEVRIIRCMFLGIYIIAYLHIF